MTPLEIEQLRRTLDERDLEPEYRRQIMQRMSAGAVPVSGGPPNEMAPTKARRLRRSAVRKDQPTLSEMYGLDPYKENREAFYEMLNPSWDVISARIAAQKAKQGEATGAENVIQGMTWNYADNAARALGFDDAADRINQKQAEFREKHPIGSTAYEMLGGGMTGVMGGAALGAVAPGVSSAITGTTLPRQMLMGAAANAADNALYESGEENSTAGSIATQGAIGAVAGAAFPAAIRGGKAIFDKASPYVSDAYKAWRGARRRQGPISRIGAGEARKGITAYHGSPADFDKFSMDKIGTGEGAQAYGHGLYFAENKGVAKRYRDDLTQMRVSAAKRQLEKFGGDTQKAKQAAVDEIERLKSLPNGGGDIARRDRLIGIQEEKLAEINALEQSGQMSQGRLYEVNIDASPDDFLDWDKPSPIEPKSAEAMNVGKELELIADNDYGLYQKRETVQRAINKYFNNPSDKTTRKRLDWYLKEAGLNDGIKGVEDRYGLEQGVKIHRDMSAKGLSSDEQRKYLLDQGYKGIRYKDAMSRQAGEGTNNYVVFDDSIISIVKKYGIAGAIAAGLISQQQGEALAAQGYE